MKNWRSTRNRHTGRINSAKAAILKNGEPLTTSDGRTYYARITGKFKVTLVRDFAAL